LANRNLIEGEDPRQIAIRQTTRKHISVGLIEKKRYFTITCTSTSAPIFYD